jgi:glycosyltransferase involved in cell wall biosynthesis
MFSESEIEIRGNHYKLLARHSDIVILSSYDALEDYKNFAPEFAHKGRVLHFVSIPDTRVYEENKNLKEKIYSKYNLNSKFFYMPNQFWKHKNHKVVFEAVNQLKKSNLDIQVVFTGHLNDYRNNDHISELQDCVKQNNLEENIKILGLVEYEEVLFLMRNCISLINPSLFEGWNTMVEEAKSIGKNIILSDLKVHREQNPPEAIYFDPNNSEQLAEILKNKWQNSEGGPDYELEEKAKASLNARIVEFAKTYEGYVMEVLTK